MSVDSKVMIFHGLTIVVIDRGYQLRESEIPVNLQRVHLVIVFEPLIVETNNLQIADIRFVVIIRSGLGRLR